MASMLCIVLQERIEVGKQIKRAKIDPPFFLFQQLHLPKLVIQCSSDCTMSVCMWGVSSYVHVDSSTLKYMVPSL